MLKTVFVLVINEEDHLAQVTLWRTRQAALDYLYEYVCKDYSNKLHVEKFRIEMRELINAGDKVRAIDYCFELANEMAYNLERQKIHGMPEQLGLQEAADIVLGCARVGTLDRECLKDNKKLQAVRDREIEARGMVRAALVSYMRKPF